MSKENEKDVDIKSAIEIAMSEIKAEQVEKEATEVDVKALVKEAIAEAKDAEVKEVKAVEVKTSPVITVKDVPCGQFKSKREMEMFAKAYVPKHMLEKLGNQKALTTYQNITTDADGGSFDPITVNGILADSVEKYPSFEEDTLQVPAFNSSATFINHTGDATAYMIGEATAGTESKPANVTETVTLKKIMTLAPITSEVIRFGTLADVTNATLASMARATSYKKQWLIFGADGTADTTDGGITGTIEGIDAVANNAAEYEVAGEWDAITNTDISNIATSLRVGDPSKFAWYMHQNQWGVIEAIARALGGNQYVVQTGQRPIPMLFGYPVKFANVGMPSAFVEDKIGMLFGDLSGMTATAKSQQVYTDMSNDFYFDADVVSLRMIQHFGVNCYQPGTSSVIPSMRAVKYNASS